MTHALVSLAFVFALAGPVAAAHSSGGHAGGYHGGYHGGWHGGWHGSHGHVFVTGGVFFDPFWFGYPYAPYYYYPYPYYGYYPYYGPGDYPAPGQYPDYPPPAEEGAENAPPPGEPPGGAIAEAAPQSAPIPTYGLVQLRGVPNGSAVDLDGRYWLTADSLDNRWLALPEGSHTVMVHLSDGTSIRRTVDVKPGGSLVVRFRTPTRG